MGILDIARRVENSLKVFKEHSVMNLDLETKIYYLNGLGLVANVDEDFDEREKEYLLTLINTFKLPKKQLNEVLLFSKKLQEDDFKELLEKIKESNLVSIFLLDSLVVSYADKNFKESETSLFNIYCNILEISKGDKINLLKFNELLNKKDYNEIFNYIYNSNFILEKKDVNYLLEYYGVFIDDIEFSISELTGNILEQFVIWYVYSKLEEIFIVDTSSVKESALKVKKGTLSVLNNTKKNYLVKLKPFLRSKTNLDKLSKMKFKLELSKKNNKDYIKKQSFTKLNNQWEEFIKLFGKEVFNIINNLDKDKRLTVIDHVLN